MQLGAFGFTIIARLTCITQYFTTRATQNSHWIIIGGHYVNVKRRYWYDTEENTLYKDVNLDFEAANSTASSVAVVLENDLTTMLGLDKPRRGSILYEVPYPKSA